LRTLNHDAVSTHANFVNVAFNKDAFPTRRPLNRQPTIVQPCQNKPGFSCVNLSKRNIRLSFALRSQAAQLCQPSRSIGPAFWNLFTRRGSRFENSGFHPLVCGACADVMNGT